MATTGAKVVTAEPKGAATLLPRAAFAVFKAAMKLALKLLDSAAALAASALAELTLAVKVILIPPARRVAMAFEVTVQPVLGAFVVASQMPIAMASALS